MRDPAICQSIFSFCTTLRLGHRAPLNPCRSSHLVRSILTNNLIHLISSHLAPKLDDRTTRRTVGVAPSVYSTLTYSLCAYDVSLDMDKLPEELVLAITSRCNVQDLPSIARVSHQWQRIAYDLRKGLTCVNELEQQS